MSKLFKDLNYDSDRVMQPGDPITSADGHTTVSADNSGKAKIVLPSGALKHPKITFAAGSYVTGTQGKYTWNNDTTYDFSSWTPGNPVSDYTNVNGLQLWWDNLSGYTFSISMNGSFPYIFDVSDNDTYNPTVSGMHSNGGDYNPSFTGTVMITRDPILAEKTLATEDQIPTLDRMTSPDGETVVVQANNDGTFKKTTKESAPKECLYATFEAAGHTVAVSFNHTKDELLAGVPEIEFTVTYDGTDYACSAVNPGGGGSYVDYVQIRSDLSWLVGAGLEIVDSGLIVIFSVGEGSPVSGALYGGWVNSTTTKQIVQTITRDVATTDQIPTIPSTSSLFKGNGSGGVSSAVDGTDYTSPSTVNSSIGAKIGYLNSDGTAYSSLDASGRIVLVGGKVKAFKSSDFQDLNNITIIRDSDVGNFGKIAVVSIRAMSNNTVVWGVKLADGEYVTRAYYLVGSGSTAGLDKLLFQYPDSNIRYSLSTITPTTSGTSATAKLLDRAMNSVTLSSTITSATFTLPAAVSGYARDFMVRLVVQGSTVPTITLSDTSTPTIDFGSDWWDNLKQGTNLVLFTEVAAGHWLVSSKGAES